MAACGAWTEDNTFTARLCFYETPYIITVTLMFSEDEVRCNAEANVGFGPTKEPERIGKAEQYWSNNLSRHSLYGTCRLAKRTQE